jgi:hypothetical protein
MVRLRRLCAALLVLALLPSMAFAQQPAKNTEAQRHYDAGLAYVDDPTGPKWDEALREFRMAYKASGQWKLQNNIGLCALNLERDAEAIAAYKDYLAQSAGELPADKRKQIEKDIATLSASLVHVEVEVEHTDATIVDERKNTRGEIVSNRYPVQSGKTHLGIHPGYHRIIIEAPGYVSDEWSFEAEPATFHTHRFRLESSHPLSFKSETPTTQVAKPSSQISSPTPPTLRPTPTSVYVGLVMTSVFAAAATTTGVIAMNKNKDLQDTSDPVEGDKIAESGKTFTLLTDISLGATLISAGATAYFYFSRPQQSSPSQGKPQHLTVSPIAGPNSAGMVFMGAF